jgi:S-adenosylmethionine:tRNA ribosyltransferase-isomerase
MQLIDFDFNLPQELIAQTPSYKRGESDLLVVQNDDFYIRQKFSEIIKYFKKGDLIVFNNSKVIKSRLIFNINKKEIELFLNKNLHQNTWHCFAKPAKLLNVGDVFTIGKSKIVILSKDQMDIKVDFILDPDDDSVFNLLDKHGKLPLPPYIKREPNTSDENRYQNVFAQHLGSVAAPTAGLHFTEDLLHQIKDIGVKIAFITLHVGAGTFLPIKVDNILDHKMHSENYFIDQNNADLINDAKSQNRRIIAVGTTSMRVLESWNGKSGHFETDIFIKPGFKFKMVDMLITNFHLPKSTLLILISAFAGINNIKKAYQYAIDQKMRFFSYGDAMLLYKGDNFDS